MGGNGFLGSYVVDGLVRRGHTVTVFDRFSGQQNWESAGVRRVVGDFLDDAQLGDAVRGQDVVLHLLSTTTPASAESDPTLDLASNVRQSVELFARAAAAGVSRVLFASTGGAMYGAHAEHAVSEATAPAPLSPYAIGKLAIEGYLRYFQRVRGLDSTIFRISNPYGPRQHPGRQQGVIPIFLERIARGEPIRVHGDGTSVRDYLFAADAAEMIVETLAAHPRHDIYNIGSGTGHSLNEVIEIAREVTGRPIAIDRMPAPATAVDRIVLNTRRYTEEFGQRPLVELRDGMSRTWRTMNGAAG